MPLLHHGKARVTLEFPVDYNDMASLVSLIENRCKNVQDKGMSVVPGIGEVKICSVNVTEG